MYHTSHLTKLLSISCRLNLEHFLRMFTDRCENILKAEFLYEGISINIPILISLVSLD